MAECNLSTGIITWIGLFELKTEGMPGIPKRGQSRSAPPS